MSANQPIAFAELPADDGSYDSDELAGTSSDEGGCSADVSRNSLKDGDDDEEYGNFLRSVFCDVDGQQSSCSLSDEEEDEEEYRPQGVDSNDEEDDDDDDDDGDDDGLIKVARMELVDLVDGCWQAIAGEPVQLVAPSSEASTKQKLRVTKRSLSECAPEEGSMSGLDEDSSHHHTKVFISTSDTIRSSRTFSPPPHCENQRTAESSGQHASSGHKQSVSGQQSASQSLISNLVRQIFSGEKPSAVCLDGMPVDAIRKLVARQMSMASQMLVQMLLAAEDRSLCFNTCYTSLMELSNYRESALKKAALLQMNMKNLRAAAFHKISQLHQIGGSSGSRMGPSFGVESVESSPTEMRLTRGIAGRQSKAQGSSARSTSLFDLPMLSDITELFEKIDLSRKEIKLKVASSLKHSSPSSSTPHNLSSRPHTDSVARSRAEALIALKVQMQRIATPSDSSVPSTALSALTKTRVWECLIPTPSYPLGEDVMAGTDMSSLMGRSLFTPAEDDLLLRGIIKHGEDSWKLIREHFLPSKEEQLLQFRFRQMTSPTAKEASKFKRYTALEKSSRGRDVWTHDEDLDLLRGYQIYGDKWPLISIFFFPHRCRKELKARWQAIQKHWQRAFSGNLSLITFQTELPPHSKMLLHFLKESSNSNNNNGGVASPLLSPSRSRYQTAANGSYPPPHPLPLPLSLSSRDTLNGSHPVNAPSLPSTRHTTVKGRLPHTTRTATVDDCVVEADELADSDEEEERPREGVRDLDWHLGRLTSRQSVLSQWSQTLSSTAALYSGYSNNNISINSKSFNCTNSGSSSSRDRNSSVKGQPVTTQSVPSNVHKAATAQSVTIDHQQGDGRGSTCHHSTEQIQSRVAASQQQQQQQHQQLTATQTDDSGEEAKTRGGHKPDSYGHARLVPANTASVLVDRSGGVPVEVHVPFATQYLYQECSYGFDSLSNMTNILGGAKALLDADSIGRTGVMHAASSRSKNSNSNSNSSSANTGASAFQQRTAHNLNNHTASLKGAAGVATESLFAAVLKDSTRAPTV